MNQEYDKTRSVIMLTITLTTNWLNPVCQTEPEGMVCVAPFRETHQNCASPQINDLESQKIRAWRQVEAGALVNDGS